MKKYFIGSVLIVLLLIGCTSTEGTPEPSFASPTGQPLVEDTKPTTQELAPNSQQNDTLIESTQAVTQTMRCMSLVPTQGLSKHQFLSPRG
jgi:hypothetical protein